MHFPGLVLMQRFVRRFLARRKQEITVAELDSLIEQAATRIQRTARCYLFRVRLSRRPPASIAAPVFSGPLNDAPSQPDAALPKPVTVDWTVDAPTLVRVQEALREVGTTLEHRWRGRV